MGWLTMKGKLRVLVVDDEPRARHAMRALLRTWPHVGPMEEALDGRQAIQIVERFAPDLVLMDVRMYEMDGLRATREIKRRWPATKVVLISMYASYERSAWEAGADAFLCKGGSPDQIVGRLADLMRTKPAAHGGRPVI
jgi:DNA-binding NarL/FixJ family response regulator